MNNYFLEKSKFYYNNYINGKLTQKVSAKLEDGKIKQYSKDEIEMIDQEVNIEIDQSRNILNYADNDENIDIKNLDNDKNSSTGNI